MCDPVEQDFHAADRFDDPQIGTEDILLRHLCVPVQVMPTSLGLKISDQAFKARKIDPGTSVDLDCLLKKCGIKGIDRKGLMPNAYALVAVTAGAAREHSGGVAWTPKPEEPELGGFAAKPNPFHGEIIRPMNNAGIRNLAAKAELLWVKSDVMLGPFEGRPPINH
ncbi:MAG: hypothetical protein RL367_2622 [Pseudomonadota bacterium]|jgi:hypothetical protein